MSHYNPRPKPQLPPQHCLDYSTTMQNHIRGLGEVLWTPSQCKKARIHVGDVGNLESGTFIPMFDAYTPGKVERRYGGSLTYHKTLLGAVSDSTGVPVRYSTRSTLERGDDTPSDYYARLELASGCVTTSCEPDREFIRWMCSQWERWIHWQKVSVPDHYSSDLVLVTGYSEAKEWRAVVGKVPASQEEFDEQAALADLALEAKESAEGSAQAGRTGLVSVRFYKALYRDQWKANGPIPKKYRTIVDDVLEYILRTNKDVDIAITGHDDIDRFLQEAPKYAEIDSQMAQLNENTTYADLSRMLGTTLRPTVEALDYKYPVTIFNWPKSKKQAGVLPFIFSKVDEDSSSTEDQSSIESSSRSEDVMAMPDSSAGSMLNIAPSESDSHIASDPDVCMEGAFTRSRL